MLVNQLIYFPIILMANLYAKVNFVENEPSTCFFLHFMRVAVRLSGEALQRVQNKPLLYFAGCCAEVRIKNCARDYNTLAELAKTYTASLRVRTPLRICPFGWQRQRRACSLFKNALSMPLCRARESQDLDARCWYSPQLTTKIK